MIMNPFASRKDHIIAFDGADADALQIVLGNNNENINYISEEFEHQIICEDNTFTFKNTTDEEAQQIQKLLLSLYELAVTGKPVRHREVSALTNQMIKKKAKNPDELIHIEIGTDADGTMIYPMSDGQLEMINSFNAHELTFIVGACGTGKSFVTNVYAANQLKAGKVKQIIVVNSLIEHRDTIKNYISGDTSKLPATVFPYIRIYERMFGKETFLEYLGNDMIRFVPLKDIRGLSLNHAFTILDDAQEVSFVDTRSLLTRLGHNSKLVVLGDNTLLTSDELKKTGLYFATILEDIDEEYIGIIKLENSDVVSSKIVKIILEQIDLHYKYNKLQNTFSESLSKINELLENKSS